MGLPSHHRWSMHSTAALSSVPSSPRSSFRSPSLFDRPFSDAGMDSSRPTTPGTDAGDMSYFAALSGQLHGVGIYHSLDEVVDEEGIDATTPRKPPRRAASPEGDDDEQDPEHSLVDFSQPVPHVRPIRVRKLRPMSFTDDDLPAAASSNDYSGHGLHRSASHESLLSVSGMDIHTLKSRPSQMLTGQNIRSFSPQPTICVTTAQADRPSLNSKSSQAMLSGVVEDGNDQNAGLGKRVSGWMFGRWGSSPSQPSPLNPARNITVGKPTRSASAQEDTTEDTIDEYSDDGSVEGTDYADTERGGIEAESGGLLDDEIQEEQVEVDDNYGHVQEQGKVEEDDDQDWRFGVCSPFG